MDVRSIEDVAAVVEHDGTVPVGWLVSRRETKDLAGSAPVDSTEH